MHEQTEVKSLTKSRPCQKPLQMSRRPILVLTFVFWIFVGYELRMMKMILTTVMSIYMYTYIDTSSPVMIVVSWNRQGRHIMHYEIGVTIIYL